MAAGDISKALVVNVRRRLGEQATSGLADAEIYQMLERGQRALGWLLRDAAIPDLTGYATGTLTASEAALPTDFWRVRALVVGGVVAKAWPIEEEGELGVGMVQPSATDVYYKIWWDTATSLPKLLVKIGDDASTAAYEVFYIRVPADISSTVDPVLGTPLHDLIEDFAVIECLKLRKRHDEAAIETGYFLRRVAIVNSRFGGAPAFEGEAGDPATYMQGGQQ